MKYLSKQLGVERDTDLKATFDFIKNGGDTNKDLGIERYATDTRLSQYKKGLITRDYIIDCTRKRVDRASTKAWGIKQARLDTIAKADTFTSGTITIEWSKSAYGMNPKARFDVYTKDSKGTRHFEHYQGVSVGGYGYDKPSTAFAGVANQCNALLKLLCEKVEQSAIIYYKGNALGVQKTKREILGYGSGYDVIPNFEGGVGISSFYTIFENIGFELKNVASGKSFDVYTIERLND